VTRFGDLLLWAIFYYRSSPNLGASFFRGKAPSSILTENRLGYILGDFFTNSSGHPALLGKYYAIEECWLFS
jgi:hypothetical protein